MCDPEPKKPGSGKLQCVLLIVAVVAVGWTAIISTVVTGAQLALVLEASVAVAGSAVLVRNLRGTPGRIRRRARVPLPAYAEARRALPAARLAIEAPKPVRVGAWPHGGTWSAPVAEGVGQRDARELRGGRSPAGRSGGA
jgi:hypothetical protein